MKTLLLDQTTWDLCLDSSGNMAVAAEPYSIAQDVCSAIRLFLGELWYQKTKGVPYFGLILGKRPPIALLKSQLVNAALGVPLVTGATCYITKINGRTVTGQLQFTYQTAAQAAAGASGGVTTNLINFTSSVDGSVQTYVSSSGAPLQFVGS